MKFIKERFRLFLYLQFLRLSESLALFALLALPRLAKHFQLVHLIQKFESFQILLHGQRA